MLPLMVLFLCGLVAISRPVDCQHGTSGDSCITCDGREGESCFTNNVSGTCYNGKCLGRLSSSSKMPHNVSETNSSQNARRLMKLNARYAEDDASVPHRLRRRLLLRNGRVHFPSCWNLHDKGGLLTVNIGLLVDNSYLRRQGEENIHAHLAKSVAFANRVLTDQMDIVLVAKRILLARSTARFREFANAPWLYDVPSKTLRNDTTCQHDGESKWINWRLEALNKWARGADNKDVSFWMLFTGCSYRRGSVNTLGLANVAGVCRKDRRNGIVATKLGESADAQNDVVEHTFMHEVGHLFGARHTMPTHEKWESHIKRDGVSLYGIMGSRSPFTWQGIYQFHPIHVENICAELNAATLSGDSYGAFSTCFSNYACPKFCSAKIGDGTCHEECNTIHCNFDGADCEKCPGCFKSMLGDGQCDDECNKPECHFDNQDCSCSTDHKILKTCAQSFECWLNCGAKITDKLGSYVPLAARQELNPWIAQNLNYCLFGIFVYVVLSLLSARCCCCCSKRKRYLGAHGPPSEQRVDL